MKRVLKRVGLGLLVVIAVVGVSVAVYAHMLGSAFDESMQKVYDVPLPKIARTTDPVVVARGKHVVDAIAACSSRDCHGGDLGGGNVLDMGPLASLAAPNITPAGLGAAYSDAELARLIHHGIKKDGRSVRFMPVQEFSWLPDADVAAAVSYLRTVPPVTKPNQPMVIKTLGKVLDRRGAVVLDVARHIDHAHVGEAPEPSPTADYGKYLSRLCTGCHGENLSGGPIPGAPPSIPTPLNLTPDKSGLAGWSFDDFNKLLTAGVRKNGKKLDPFMPVSAFGKMDDTEKKALWAYLDEPSLAPVRRTMSDPIPRRRFLTVLAAMAGGAAVSCSKARGASPAVCTDTRGLATADAEARVGLSYVDHEPEPGKSCSRCQQFEPSDQDGQCGKCKVLRGPISPDGYCNAFTPRV